MSHLTHDDEMCGPCTRGQHACCDRSDYCSCNCPCLVTGGFTTEDAR